MPPLVEDDESDNEDVISTNGPTMKAIPPDRRSEGIDDVSIEGIDDDDEDNRPRDYEPEFPIESDLRANEERTNRTAPEPQDDKDRENRTADWTCHRNRDSQGEIDGMLPPEECSYPVQ